jgi:hypothetical protein
MGKSRKEVHLNAVRKFALAVLTLLGLSLTMAHAGVFIGVGVPGPFYRHYYRPYYGPRIVVGLPPVYIGGATAPVYVQPAPVYVQPAPPVQYAPPAAPATQAPPASSPYPATPALPSAPVPVRN